MPEKAFKDFLCKTQRMSDIMVVALQSQTPWWLWSLSSIEQSYSCSSWFHTTDGQVILISDKIDSTASQNKNNWFCKETYTLEHDSWLSVWEHARLQKINESMQDLCTLYNIWIAILWRSASHNSTSYRDIQAPINLFSFCQAACTMLECLLLVETINSQQSFP